MMAKGTDSEEFMLVSGARSGLKREFAFALKVQSELAGSLGQRRAKKVSNSHSCGGVSENSSNKRLKSSCSESKGGEKNGFLKSENKDLAQPVSIKNPKSDEYNSPTAEEEIQADSIKSSDNESANDIVVNAVKSSDKESTNNAIVNAEKPLKEVAESPKEEVAESPKEEVADKSPTDDLEKSPEEVAMDKSPKDDLEKSPEEVAMDKSPEEEVMEKSPEEEAVEKPLKEEVMEKPLKEVMVLETPDVTKDNSEVNNASVNKPLKMYSRNIFRTRVEPVGVSPIAAVSSGSSVVSEDACKNEAVGKDGGKVPDIISPLRTSPKSKLEMKMSKKIVLTKLPTRIKELLQTGMLEGLHVSYRAKRNGVLCGTIKDCGILCSCSSCEGSKVVTPFQFEKHAGSANKHPAEYIYLENGNSLRDVLNACKDAPLDTLETTLQRAIAASAVKNSSFCQNCKGPLPASRIATLFCNSCLESKKSHASPASIAGPSARVSRTTLTQKLSSSESKSASSTPQNKIGKGKLTRKDLRLHKLVFEEDGLPDGTELAYYIRGQKLLEGYKKGFGIFCRCCNSEVSPSQFEAHAGWSSRRKPYLNIYTSNGVSLHELSVSLSRGRDLSAKDNDDLCSICADFGDLLLCDGCPRAFHQDCVGLANIPNGKWYCPYCLIMYQREKSCEYNANAKAAGRVAGVDPIEQITKRCIRIVETTETEVGGCVLCRSHGFSKSGFGPGTVILCDQCEKEFHVGCLKDHNMADLKELPQGKWFCCTDCNRIHTVLQKLVVNGSEKLPDSLSNIIKKKYDGNDSDKEADLDVRWSLISGKIASNGSKELLSKAVAIFHNCFNPIIDAKTGRDLIPSMVFGRNIRDQDFEGVYCAVLTVNSYVVSAGILRIFGQEVAELPLVATSTDNQGKGYFQSLFSCIERLLAFLNVSNLVLPAAEEAESIWTTKFGFQKIDEEQLHKYRKDYQLMTFQGTSMLQKPVPKCRIVGRSSEQS